MMDVANRSSQRHPVYLCPVLADVAAGLVIGSLPGYLGGSWPTPG
jgi:hypothetical protein